MDLRTFSAAFTQIAEEKGIPQEKVLEVIEAALAAAYKRDYAKKSQQVRVKFDPESGSMQVWQVLLVVDPEQVVMPEETEEEEAAEGAVLARKAREEEETRVAQEGAPQEEEKIRYNDDRHIFIADARKIQKDIQVGEELLIPLESHEEFGRIAAQTAKQVIIQRLREAERDAIMEEYSAKQGEIVSGIIQRVEGRTVYVDLGRVIAQLFPQDQIPGEFYRVGRRIRFFLSEVSVGGRGPQIILSRSHPKFVSKLFEIEVPEVASGAVVIKAIAREAGSRTKIAVASEAEGIDPIGSCIGQKGTRVMTVISELGGEKIDVIQWDDDPARFIGYALSPAKVSDVELAPRSTAVVTVPDEQLSLAIGKDGQNVRLAAKLSNWKIDIRGVSGEKVEGGEASPEEGEKTEAAGEKENEETPMSSSSESTPQAELVSEEKDSAALPKAPPEA